MLRRNRWKKKTGMNWPRFGPHLNAHIVLTAKCVKACRTIFRLCANILRSMQYRGFSGTGRYLMMFAAASICFLNIRIFWYAVCIPGKAWHLEKSVQCSFQNLCHRPCHRTCREVSIQALKRGTPMAFFAFPLRRENGCRSIWSVLQRIFVIQQTNICWSLMGRYRGKSIKLDAPASRLAPQWTTGSLCVIKL